MASGSTSPYPPKPEKFIRITDNMSAIQFGCYGSKPPSPPDDSVGFDVGYSTRFIQLCHRLTSHSVRCHLDWSPLCEWKGLISVCSTEEKAEKEIQWRLRKKRLNITKFEISTRELQWTTLKLSSDKEINVLASNNYNEPVIFIKATELIQALGLTGTLKPEAEGGARNEWLALEWIPKDMVTIVGW
jgi:hypothetical protein